MKIGFRACRFIPRTLPVSDSRVEPFAQILDAGDGARIALLNRHKRAEAARIARWVTYVETAIDPHFQDEFVGAIHIPHATDCFPHLESRLAAPLRRHLRTPGAVSRRMSGCGTPRWGNMTGFIL